MTHSKSSEYRNRHYAVTRSQTMEEEFLKYKKVTRDGRTAAIDGTDLYDLIQLDKRAD